MNYKKLLLSILAITILFYVSDNNAGELAAAFKDDIEGVLGKEGGIGDRGVIKETPDSADEGFEGESGGASTATTTADDRALGDERVGTPPQEVGPSSEGAPGGKGSGEDPAAGFNDLAAARAEPKGGPKGEPKPEGKPRDGEGEPFRDRANAMSGKGREGAGKISEEESAKIDKMSDEDLLSFKAKEGENSVALTRAQDNLKLANKNFKTSEESLNTAKSELKTAEESVEATQKQLDEAIADLKEFQKGKYFKKGENDKDNIDYDFAKKRNNEIKQRISAMEKEGSVDGEVLSALRSEDEKLSKFLSSDKAFKKAKVESENKQEAFEEKERAFNRAKNDLNVARDNLRSVIKGMTAARMAAFAGTGAAGDSAAGAGKEGGSGAEPTPEKQAENESAVSTEREDKMASYDRRIKEKDEEIALMNERKGIVEGNFKKVNDELISKEQERMSLMSSGQSGSEAIKKVQDDIQGLSQRLKSLKTTKDTIAADLKKAEARRAGLVEKRAALDKAEGAPGKDNKVRISKLREDLGKVKEKVFGKSKATKEELLEKPKKEMDELKAKRAEAERRGDEDEVEEIDEAIKEKEAEIDLIESGRIARFKKYWRGTDAKTKAMDAWDGTYTRARDGIKWGLQKTKKFGYFLWEQMKIGFAFMIPGDIVATIQAAYQAKAMYSMITSVQNFAGINLYTIDGLIPRSDATNGIFLYTDTNDSGQYTDPNRRFFMSYSNYGELGTNWLGSGTINYMIEFSTGLICDNNGDPLVYGFPGVPLRSTKGFVYSGTSGSNNTITTVIYGVLPDIQRDVSGGVKREVKVDGLLEGFSTMNSTPSGNGVIGSIFATPRKTFPILFNSTLAVLKQGINSSRFGMSFRQPEGLGIVTYLLTHYQKVFEAESKGKMVELDSVEMKLIAELSKGMSVSDLTALAKGDTYKLDEESFQGISPDVNILLGNVFVYQTDDTPVVGMMRNALPAGLKSHVHDYVVGINSANAIVPILVPAVNIPAGSQVAVPPVVSWEINPDVAYVVSLVSGSTYCPGGIVLLNNGIADYTLANTVWGQVIATSGNPTAYGAISGFNNQLNAMQQLAQFMIDKGPFNLNGMYKAYRVEGLENMYTAQGITDSQLQQAQSAVLLGMAANQSGAKIASADPALIKDKKSAVENGIFIYRIDKALANGTLPDYVLPVMVNSSGNYQIVPLGSQVAMSKDGSFGGAVSLQVQALVSLVTSRMYDRNYNPLPANYVTNVLVFQTPGVPISCDVTGSYSPYTCVDGSLVEPNGENQPDATAFMETEFNPANQSEKQFSMPPYHFLMMPYDIAPITPGQQGTSVFGNVGTLGTVQTLADPLYEILPERFTGIPWPATIKKNLAIYQKFLSGFSSPALAAIKKSGQSSELTQSAQPSQETKILHQLLKNVQSIAQSNVFDPQGGSKDIRSYTITQIHDQWKSNVVKQLVGANGAWIKEWEMGPYDIAQSTTTLPASSPANPSANPITINTNWSIALLNEECALNSNYIYTLTANQTTTVNGLWVLAQVDGQKTAIMESSLTPHTASLANPNIHLSAIEKFYLVSIALPSTAVGNTSKLLQQNMVSYYNLQPRADGNYYGFASTYRSSMGHLENLFVNIGQNFQYNTKEGAPDGAVNALIDLLSGRVLILTQDGKQTYLLPLVNIQGYELTVDPAIILKTFAPHGLSPSLSAYINQNTTGYSGSSYTVSFGDKQLNLSREALDSGNYIYTYAPEKTDPSYNPEKPIDYLVVHQQFTPSQGTDSVQSFNMPVEQDVQSMMSLVDYQKVLPQSIGSQAPSHFNINGISTKKDRINYDFLASTNFFNVDLLSQTFKDGIEAAKKTARDSAISSAPVVSVAEVVSQDLVNQNAIINYEENQEHNGQYFDPTTLSQNNLTHSGDSDSIFGGNFYLYNDSNNNYFLGVGNMTGMPDSKIFDTYYAFSLQGYMGSSFPSSLANLQAPVGGYYAKNDAGKYALTQVVFGPAAEHIASTYGVYVNPKDGSQQLSIPVSMKSLFMDQATDMNLQGGKATGTFMRLLRPLPPVLEGYSYYLYENIAIPGFVAGFGQMGLKMTPSAYLVQINPPKGPATYLDLITGLAYDISGKPLPQKATVYKKSNQPVTKFNPFIAWGQDQEIQVLIPFTHTEIISSMVSNNLAAQGQNEVFAMYGTTLADVTYVYQDAGTNKQYSYVRCAPSSNVIDGNIYQLDTKTQALIKTYNVAQVAAGDTSALATDASKKITLSNKNMLLALEDAVKNGYTPYSTIYRLKPLTIDLSVMSANVSVVLPTVTATHTIGVDRWNLNYTVPAPSSQASQSAAITINENYFPTIDSNSNQLFNTVVVNAIGTYNTTSLSSGQINLTSLNSMSVDNLNLAQQLRDGFIINGFNPATNAYDKISAIVVSGTIFRPSTISGSFSNSDTKAAIACKVRSGQPFMPSFVNSAFSENVSVYQLNAIANPTGANFNTSFFSPSSVFIYAPQYVSNPQADFAEYFTAWGFEPEVSTEGTTAIVNYLEVDNLVPVTVNTAFVDSKATLGSLSTDTSGVINVREYLNFQKGKIVGPVIKTQKDFVEAAKDIKKSATLLASAPSVPKTNPYVATKLSRIGQKEKLQSAQEQITSLRQAAIEHKKEGIGRLQQFNNTFAIWLKQSGKDDSFAVKESSSPRLYYDPRSRYVVYKIGEYDKGADFYDITGITEGYILMPMIFTDKGQGVPLAGLSTFYRLSGIVFDTDGQTIHQVVSMKDLNAIQKSIGNLGTLQADRQSAQRIIFDAKIQLPQVQDVTLVAATPPANTSKAVPSATQSTAKDSSND